MEAASTNKIIYSATIMSEILLALVLKRFNSDWNLEKLIEFDTINALTSLTEVAIRKNMGDVLYA